METRVISRVKSDQDGKLTLLLLLVSRLRRSGDIPPLSYLCVCMVWTGTNIPSPIFPSVVTDTPFGLFRSITT